MQSLNKIPYELRDIVQQFSGHFSRLSDSELSAKPDAAKWSKKEILGHLIDSAHNNLRRFITGQYESTPPHIVYDQDYWVAANRYNSMDKEQVITLWTMMNERISAVLEHMSMVHYNKTCDTGKDDTSLHTIEWLAADYVSHMKHHLRQIFPDRNIS